MIDAHMTGLAALVLALAALLHALKAATPTIAAAVAVALEKRAESRRLDAEAKRLDSSAHAAEVDGRNVADADLRHRLTRCDEDRDELRAEMDRRDRAYSVELDRVRGQLAALRDELDEVRRSLTAGHSTPHQKKGSAT